MWSEEEIKILKKRYEQRNPLKMENVLIELSKKLNRSQASIRNKAYNLGITKREKYWSNTEIKYLKENYKSYNLIEIANNLKRDKTNVCRKARELGIERTNKKKEKCKTYKDENGNSHLIGWKPKTKEEIAQKRSNIMKTWHLKNEHPKGMLGKTHSKEYCKELSKRTSKRWKDKDDFFNSDEHRQNISDRMVELQKNNKVRKCYSRGKQGKRNDLNNIYFRSSWEANYARYLNFLINKKQIHKWEYEPDTFVFEEIKRGTRSYMPDFKIWNKENEKPYYVEIKGWMDNKSATKLKRMEKYYPEIKIELVREKEYKEIKQKISAFIKNWE